MDEQRYVIFYKDGEGVLNYVYEINRNTIYTSTDIQSGLFINDKSQALAIAAYCNTRSSSKKYKVLAVVTTTTVIEEE